MMSNLLSSELSKLVANTMLAQRVGSMDSISQLCEKKEAACSMFPRHQSRFEDTRNLDYICKCKGMHEVAKSGWYYLSPARSSDHRSGDQKAFIKEAIKCSMLVLRRRRKPLRTPTTKR